MKKKGVRQVSSLLLIIPFLLSKYYNAFIADFMLKIVQNEKKRAYFSIIKLLLAETVFLLRYKRMNIQTNELANEVVKPGLCLNAAHYPISIQFVKIFKAKFLRFNCSFYFTNCPNCKETFFPRCTAFPSSSY